MKGNTRRVELLIRNGADPALVTKEVDSPAELALRFGHPRSLTSSSRPDTRGGFTGSAAAGLARPSLILYI